MKRVNMWNILIIPFLVSMFLFYGCAPAVPTNNLNEVTMKEYYSREDFKLITIGKSNFQDVYKIASIESMQITSYGGVCDYPMQNGGYLRIKFYGEDLIVGSIEEVS